MTQQGQGDVVRAFKALRDDVEQFDGNSAGEGGLFSEKVPPPMRSYLVNWLRRFMAEHGDTVEAALSSSRGEQGWRTIDSAPKDGTYKDVLGRRYGSADEFPEGDARILFGIVASVETAMIKAGAQPGNVLSDARSAERARVIEMCARLPDDLAENGGQIRLHMGELTAQEMRSVKAILRYIAAALRALGQQDTADIAAAKEALADFDKNGGVTLDELKSELGQQDTGGSNA
jgi:hypothetical protein